MMRVVGLVSAAAIASQLVSSGAWAAPKLEHRHVRVHAAAVALSPPEEAPAPAASTPAETGVTDPPAAAGEGGYHHRLAEIREPGGTRVVYRPHHAWHGRKVIFAHRAVAKPEDDPNAETPPEDPALTELPPGTLTAQEESVGQIAVANGDRQFLMVDKGMGKILLFEDGKPVFIGNALTGESYADRLPPSELKEQMDNLNALDTKVTPAGRFTVTRGYDKDYGPLFDLNQIKGKDWGIAIHQVYLGIPSEHRAARLQSPREDDKNITFGCINVAPDTIHMLLRVLPEHEPTVLYVLPRDENQTAQYFSQRNS